MITSHFHLHPQFIYESFHILYIISLLSRENGNPQLTLLPMCGFIAQFVEHRTCNEEVAGSNPVEAWIFFRLLIFQLHKLENSLRWSLLTFRNVTVKEIVSLHFYKRFPFSVKTACQKLIAMVNWHEVNFFPDKFPKKSWSFMGCA